MTLMPSGVLGPESGVPPSVSPRPDSLHRSGRDIEQEATEETEVRPKTPNRITFPAPLPFSVTSVTSC